jgi:hypothetical protein
VRSRNLTGFIVIGVIEGSDEPSRHPAGILGYGRGMTAPNRHARHRAAVVEQKSLTAAEFNAISGLAVRMGRLRPALRRRHAEGLGLVVGLLVEATEGHHGPLTRYRVGCATPRYVRHMRSSSI